VSDYKSYILEEKDIGIWDDFIARSSNGTIFHRIEWLKAAEEHSKMQLLPLAVYKGDNIVCLIPLFRQNKFGFKIILSPPNSCGIPFLGPVLKIPATNRYNYERTFSDIIDHITHLIEKRIGFDYMRIINTPEIADMRPYSWKNYTVAPNYTYRFDLSKDTDDIYNTFHTSTRNAMKKALQNESICISKDRKYLYDILSLVAKRYGDQNKKFGISENYFRNLMDSSVSDNIESIAVINNGRTVAGDITLTDRNNAYAWIGGVSREENIAGAGELILWEKIIEYKQRGFTEYDFVGANTRHICKHKAKFGARLVNYFAAHKTS
jgi:hypothetical protein